MQMFTFQLYPRVHYGEGAADKAGAELARLGGKKALVVTDPGVLAAGVAQPVLSSLDAAGIPYEIFSGVETNPADIHVMAAVDAYRAAGTDSIIGLGGGSAMDVAKSAAVVMSNGGTSRLRGGVRPCVLPTPPLVQVPTTAGTGSEAVAGAIITDSPGCSRCTSSPSPAHVALCDPELTLSLPAGSTAASGIDALAHAIGAYVSAERQPLADAMALYAVSTCSGRCRRGRRRADRAARAG